MKERMISIRLEPEVYELIKGIAIEGNVSLWIRQLIDKELKKNRSDEKMLNSKIYGVCVACGEYCYRIPGKKHGDGQIDTEDNPVWLTADDAMTLQEFEAAEANRINCGCND